MYPSTVLTPAFQGVQDKLTQQQATPILGIFPSLAKALVSTAQIVTSVAFLILASLVYLATVGWLGDAMAIFIGDGLESLRDGFKGLGFSLANIATLTGLGYALKHRAQKLA